MARTISQLIGEAQFILQDEDADRYPLTRLLEITNRAMSEIQRVRPDAFFDTYDDTTDDVTLVSYTLANYTSENFPVPEMFYPAVVAYIAGAAELIDDEFSNDSRAGLLLTRFGTSLVAM